MERATYDTFKAGFLQSLKELLPLDGLYLAMHGAMYVEGMQDAEGDWISAARQVVGPQCLISASYDLHGNLSRCIIDSIDMLSAYRTAPHIDVQATKQRACDMLLHCAREQVRPTMVWAPVPVLLPGERTSTEDQPAKDLYTQLGPINAKPGVLDASLLVGYVWADEPRATASVVMTGTDPLILEQQAVQLAQDYWDARERLSVWRSRGSIVELLDQAETIATRPIILADSGDNPTGGGVGDRAEVLGELLRRKLPECSCRRHRGSSCYGALLPAVRRQQGAIAHRWLARSPGSRPVEAEAEVLFLLPTDEPRARQAVVRIQGVTVVLTATRRPFHHISDFTRLQLRIPDFRLLVVKSGYLSPELAPLANPNLMALSDGSILQDLDKLAKNEFRVRTFPFDRSFAWQPATVVSARSPQPTR